MSAAAARQERASLKGHTHIIWSVCFSRDGKTVASGSDDKTSKLRPVQFLHRWSQH